MKKYAIALATVLAATLSTSASAGGYAGLGGGVTHGNLDCKGAPNCDTSGTGLKLYGGYKFKSGAAVEAGYLNFGKVSASGRVSGDDIALTAKSDAFTIGGAFFFEENKWTFVARGGVAAIKAKVDARFNSDVGSDSETNASPYVGLGVGYQLTRNITLGLDADFTQAKYTDRKMSVRLLTATAMFSF